MTDTPSDVPKISDAEKRRFEEIKRAIGKAILTPLGADSQIIRDFEWVIAYALRCESAALLAERDVRRLREFVAWCMCDGSWMGGDIDGGDAQDKAEELGLIVEVPADEAFRAEYDSDTMFVLAWSQTAGASLSRDNPEKESVK